MFSRQKSLDIRRVVVDLPRACSFSGTCSSEGANARSSEASWEDSAIIALLQYCFGR